MTALTEMQRRAIINYTNQVTTLALELALALANMGTAGLQVATEPPAPVKRPRGRPRKHPLPVQG